MFVSSDLVALINANLRAVRTSVHCTVLPCASLSRWPYFSWNSGAGHFTCDCRSLGWVKKCQFSLNSSAARHMVVTDILKVYKTVCWPPRSSFVSFRFREAATPHAFSGALVTLHQRQQPSHTGCDLKKRSGFRDITSNIPGPWHFHQLLELIHPC